MWKKTVAAMSFVVVLIAASIGGLIGKGVSKAVMAPSAEEKEAKLIEGLRTGLASYEGQLPMMIDDETRMDRVSVEPGPRAVYHYTMVKRTADELRVVGFEQSIRPFLISQVCGSDLMKPSLQYGAIYVYAYTGRDGRPITRVEIDRNSCGLPSLR